MATASAQRRCCAPVASPTSKKSAHSGAQKRARSAAFTSEVRMLDTVDAVCIIFGKIAEVEESAFADHRLIRKRFPKHLAESSNLFPVQRPVGAIGRIKIHARTGTEI